MVSSDNEHRTTISSAVSRRTALRGLGGAGMATALGLATPRTLLANEPNAATMIEPEAGTWKTWLLTAGDQLRPEAPPDEAATQAELDRPESHGGRPRCCRSRPHRLLGRRITGLPLERDRHASDGAAGCRLDSYRLMALLNAAIYDATIAAWDAKYAYNRARPALSDAALSTAIPTPNSPSYPDEHAVTAGAAAAVLAYVFPDEAERFQTLAEEAADSRVQAGVAYPSDTAAGLALGEAVGKLFVEYAKTDGSDAEFDLATMPTGVGIWTGDPGNQPTIGARKPWVLAVRRTSSVPRPHRPPTPRSGPRSSPKCGDYARNTAPFTELWFWPQDPAGRPAPDSAPFTSSQAVFYYAPLIHYLWQPELAQKLFEYRWDTNAPRSARAYALVSIAGYDSTIACWDGKFFYWTARPDPV